ncbi:MAG: type II toxin-antitoxin system RelE/ParE family toxin [Candidatus Hydrogenedentes bacterium]|nr:type II toxin-antitoxin system RelE/ParE family toxin [Candidatus Hydrogenedentota bacterium]
MKDELKVLVCAGDTRQIIRALPVEIRQKIGRALMLVQTGDTPKNTKYLQGFRAPVQEIRISHDKEAYRAVYTVAIHDKVYLLHVFHKKSKSGIGISPRDLELIGRRLRDALAMEKE